MTTMTDKKSLLKQALDKLDDMATRLRRSESFRDAPIAVIGIGCRFPGGVRSPDDLWENLERGIHAVTEIPRERWDMGTLYDPDPSTPGKIATRHGGFVDGVDQFDPAFFGISPREAASIDPQHRFVLEVAWEALERAGQVPDELAHTKTGVFVGISTNDYARILSRQGNAHVDAYYMTGNSLNFSAGRLSYLLGLHGPAMAVDTACSSSLVAIHLACQSLRMGECEVALAGGVNLLLSPEGYLAASSARMLSRSGRCRTFDADADGMVRAEGCGIVVLKPLDAALAAEDPIVAVVRGTAVNQDGPSSGLTVPNKKAQVEVIRAALANAGVRPHDVGYVEAHGTGTPLGDPIEVRALAESLCDGRPAERPLYIASIKTNIGHAESASGVAGFIKTALSFERGSLPPHLHLEQLNPHMEWVDLAIRVPTRSMGWPSSPEGKRIAGVSSFGASGTNAHVVLEAPPPQSELPSDPGPIVLSLSARTETSLGDLARAYARHLEKAGAPPLRDLAHTTGVRRSHHEHRLSVVGRTHAELVRGLETQREHAPLPGVARGFAKAGKETTMAFVFSGHGSQWFGMGRQLFEHDPVFRQALEDCDAAMRPYADWGLVDTLRSTEPAWLDRVSQVQSALFAIGVALAARWRAWGIEPSAVVGHSMGEIAAAHVAGALGLDDAARIICQRGLLLDRVRGQGAMLLASLPLGDAEACLEGHRDRVSIAASNGPRMTVLSGDPRSVAEIRTRLEVDGVLCRVVKSDVAFHSPQMDPLVGELVSLLAGITPRAAEGIAFHSTVTGDTLTGTRLDPAYWGRNLREPVRFARAMDRLLDTGHTHFIEMSPHPTLLHAMQEAFTSENRVAVSSLRRERDDRAQLLESLAALHTTGYRVDWKRLYPSGRCADLPTYAWEHKRFWAEEPEPPVREGDDWIYEPRWRTSPRAATTANSESGAWLLVGDVPGVGGELAELLVQHGNEVLTTWPEDASTLRGVVYLGGLEAASPEKALGDLIELLQWLAPLPAPVSLFVVTRGSQSVVAGDAMVLAPDQAALWGFGRTASLEHPGVLRAMLDLDPAATGHAESAAAIFTEIAAPDGEEHLALRGGERYALRIERSAVLRGKPLESAPVSDNATYLVTGGLGALGLKVARWLAGCGARHLVLVGRNVPSRDAPGDAHTATQIASLRELEAMGVDVLMVPADVSDELRMALLFAQIAKTKPPLRGVVHAAGTATERPIVDLERGSLARELGAKVAGTWALHRLTQDLALDFFVLFGSTAAVWGLKDMSLYGAANAFLETFAHQRRAMGLPALSIAWSRWDDARIVRRSEGQTERLREQYDRMGVFALPSELALEVMGRLLATGVSHAIVAAMDWSRFTPIYEAQRRRPLIASVAAREPEANGIRGAEDGDDLRRQLESTSPARRLGRLKGIVRKEVGRVLGFGDDDILDPAAGLFELGMDSVMAVDVSRRLGSLFGRPVPVAAVFNHSSIETLARHLEEDVLGFASTRTTRVDRTEVAAQESIAVVGMGCRFPGGIESTEALWRLLEEGRTIVSKAPRERWAADAFDDDGDAWHGAFLDRVDHFDYPFFGISPREAAALDPQHRLLLTVAWEALEHAGVAPESLAGSATGVFVGIAGAEYNLLRLRSAGAGDYDVYDLTGNALSCAAGRLAFVLDLQGPAVSIDTACSSSLSAVYLACQSLRAGETHLALAGGVSVIASPLSFAATTRGKMIAHDGLCKTFDARADGYGRGEGCGLVVLKRLSDALAGDDVIHGVIRGIAMVHDGHSSGLTVPNGLAQVKVIRRALADAQVKPSEVSYVEAHGTGTALGDPIEIESLRAALGDGRDAEHPLWVGSVKTNFGHLEAASGVAGLMKAILSLQRARIPAHLNFERLNPEISLSEIPAIIPTEALAWPAHRAHIAGVSSFGFSGTNVHLVLGEPPARTAAEAREDRIQLVPLSARSPEALSDAVRASVERFGTVDASLESIGYASARKRGHHAQRLAVVAGSRSDWVEALRAFGRGEEDARVISGLVRSDRSHAAVFIYPGQGSQWIGMGRELLVREPVFRAEFDRVAHAMKDLVDFSLHDEIARDDGPLANGAIDVVQPVLFALESAYTALWRSWGIEPEAVVGHSKGEATAAYIAGALSLEDAASVICIRSRLLRRMSGHGGILIVGLPLAKTEAALAPYAGRLWVSASNGPTMTAVGGDLDALDTLAASLREGNVYCQPVRTDVASHTPKMDPLREDLLAALAHLKPRAAAIPIYSTVTGQVSDGACFDARYWVDNLCKPVLFAPVIETMLGEAFNVFLEMSPHPSLLHAVDDAIAQRGADAITVPSGRRSHDERQTLLDSLGRLYVRGVPVAWEQLYPSGAAWASLPPYPWQTERVWLAHEERGHAHRARTWRAGDPGRPLLHGRTPVAASGVFVWEMRLDAERLAYLSDHRVQGNILFPATGYIEMALAAAEEVFGPGAHLVRDVAFRSALQLTAGEPELVQVAVTLEMTGLASFQIATLRGPSDEPWDVHVQGTLVSSPATRARGPRLDVESLRARCTRSTSHEALYEALTARGLNYGASFRGIGEAHAGDGEAIATLVITEPHAAGYLVHPALLDAALHPSILALPSQHFEAGDAVLPVAVARVQVHGPPADAAGAYVRISPRPGATLDMVSIDASIFDGDGHVLVEISGMDARRLGKGATANEAGTDGWLYELAWPPQPLPAPAPDATAARGGWLLFDAGDGLVASLRSRLEAEGGTCHTVTLQDLDPTSPDAYRELVGRAFENRGVELRGVVHAWSLAAGSLEETQDRGCISALYLAQAIADSAPSARLWLVTRGAQAYPPGAALNVAQAPILGLGRVLANELPGLSCTRIDLDAVTSSADGDALFDELGCADGENEIAWRGGTRHVARLAVRPRESGLASESRRRVSTRQAGVRLEIPIPGSLDNLTLVEVPRRDPGEGEVEIQVVAAALNFSDVMKAMGVYPNPPRGVHVLGGECAGRVSRVGPGVANVHVGDDVVAMAPYAAGSFVTVKAARVVRKPTNLSFEEAAAIPTVFLTAHHALVTLGRMERGESVLVHAASGGVGLAAMQLARHLGGIIFATAGSEEKRDYVRALGCAHHVMDSRSLDFADEVRRRTSGRGVDLVLNSLTGAALAKGMEALAPGGRFLEIGKRDIYANSRLGMLPFRNNVAFFAIDLQTLAEQKPDALMRTLEGIFADMEQGHLTPLPVRSFPLSQAVDAFRHMAQAQHVGKIVLTVEEPEVVATRGDALPLVRSDGHYLITGGLGDLGLEVARWMVGEGARHLTLMGRRAPSPAAHEAISEMQRAGAQVHVACGDVSDRAQVDHVFRGIAASSAPLRGVIHAAVALDDGMILNLDRERFLRVMAARVAGSQWLHEHCTDPDLDFFVLFSSASSILGTPGQANYAAASAFMDALAHARRSQGLPAQTINWGPWANIGLAARGVFGARLRSNGAITEPSTATISPERGIEALARILQRGWIQTVVMPAQPEAWKALAPNVVDIPMVRKLFEAGAGAGAKGTRGALREALEAVDAGPKRRTMLEGYICEQIAQVLRFDTSRVGAETPFGTLGFDSLLSLEVRNRLARGLGVTLPVTLLWSHANAAALAVHLASEMSLPLEPLASLAVEEMPTQVDALDASALALLEQMSALSKSELQKLLEAPASNQETIL
ncbi:SDR family NAD(P)-dependent oxidoreductase [Pendulispora rubella]|uniref:SDR family NAD(P)-dependent oxidoreductase n=1 Tax=Pendulispora rubella TaxID=2741070 RepID=A0ABZ2LI75_9BACT